MSNGPVIHGGDHRDDDGPDPVEGRWNLFTPIAPADVPTIYIPGVAFGGPWGNIAGYPPSGYRRAIGGLRFRLSVTGGEAEPGSTIATLPVSFREPWKQRLWAQLGSDGTGIAAIEANPDGTLVFVGELTLR